MKHGVHGGTPAEPGLVIIGEQQNAVHHRHAKKRDETDGGGNAEAKARDIKGQDAARDGKGNAG